MKLLITMLVFLFIAEGYTAPAQAFPKYLGLEVEVEDVHDESYKISAIVKEGKQSLIDSRFRNLGTRHFNPLELYQIYQEVEKKGIMGSKFNLDKVNLLQCRSKLKFSIKINADFREFNLCADGTQGGKNAQLLSRWNIFLKRWAKSKFR
jgi:hypothetical protein